MAGVRKPRIINTSHILRDIWVSRRISRVQLARDLNLNKSTITNIVSDLIDQEIIMETAEGAAGPTGGRKPVHIELNRKFGYVIGLELFKDTYSAVAVDLAGDILFSRSEHNELPGDDLAEIVVNLLESLREELSWIDIPLLGVGLGVSGIVNSEEGIIIGSIPHQIPKPFPLVDKISNKIKVPVFVDNDANACAWGELAFHRTKKLRNFLFTLIEFHDDPKHIFYENTAVGLGIVIEGKVYYGHNYSAGEFRSLFCQPEDKGQSSVSSRQDHIYKDREQLTLFFKEISQHLALFANTFNLSQIFLGGDIQRYQDIVMPILLDALAGNWMYDSPVDCEIRFSSLGDKAVAYGAAGLVLERLFADPEVLDRLGMGTWNSTKALTSLLEKKKSSVRG